MHEAYVYSFIRGRGVIDMTFQGAKFRETEFDSRRPRQVDYRLSIIIRLHDNSSTDISSTTLRLPDISSTTVYQGTGQLYIQLLIQQILIFINSNFCLHYDSHYQSHFHWHYDITTDIVSKHCGMKIQLVFQLKTLIFINHTSS